MKRRHISVLSGVAVAAVALSMAPAQAQAIPAQGDKEPKAANREHDLPNPLGDAQRALRKQAVDKLIKGEATTEMLGAAGHQARGQRQGSEGQHRGPGPPCPTPWSEESISSRLRPQFGFDATLDPCTTRSPHRPQLGRQLDRRQLHVLDRRLQLGHYEDMMFGQGESFKDFYLKQSNGRFLAKGDVSDWVTVYNEARYGDKNNADGYWNYVTDTANAWYDAQLASGKTDAEIATYLKQFDQVDRYDGDGDGNFNEPDGYIDHFQAIHAGEGEEAGGGAQGEDAIWSHRWYVNSTDIGQTGPRTSSVVSRSVAQASGSATTRPSPRTAASACSRTSSATTSACRTTTTPRVATTAPASGR